MLLLASQSLSPQSGFLVFVCMRCRQRCSSAGSYTLKHTNPLTDVSIYSKTHHSSINNTKTEMESNWRSMEDNPVVWFKDSQTRSDGFRKEQSSDLNDKAQPLIFNYRNCDSWNGVLRFRRGKSIWVVALISANCRHFSNFLNYRLFKAG